MKEGFLHLSKTGEQFLRQILDVFDTDCRAPHRPTSTSGFTFQIAALEGSGSRDILFYGRLPADLKERGTKKIYARPSVVILPLDLRVPELIHAKIIRW